MKILHIHPSMAGGGIESMICALSNQMAKNEDVVVCSIFEPVDSDTFWFKLSPLVKKTTLGKKNAGFSFKVCWQILRFIRDGKYDIVNVHGMFYYYVLSVLFLRRRTKFFYTVHSDANMENTIWDKRLFVLKRYCFKKGWLHPITISNISQKSFEDLYNVPSVLIFNGVSRQPVIEDSVVSTYKISENTKVFIHAGRISLAKNQAVLCKVFKRLIEEGNDVVLLIAGAKQSNEIFSNIMKYFSDRIVYLGQRDDIVQIMAHSDGMCLPSLWEGLPVTLLEALSVGCIPICSNVGGIPDVIKSGYNGFLSNSPAEQDYYKIMQTYLSMSQVDYRRIRKNCMGDFVQYDIVNTSRQYVETYKSEY